MTCTRLAALAGEVAVVRTRRGMIGREDVSVRRTRVACRWSRGYNLDVGLVRGKAGGWRTGSAGDSHSVGIALERTPLVRQQLTQTISRIGHDTSEDVVEIFPRIDVAGLAGADKTEV